MLGLNALPHVALCDASVQIVSFVFEANADLRASIQDKKSLPHCTGTTLSAEEYKPQIGKFFLAMFAAMVVDGFVPPHTGTIAAAFCP